MGLIIPAASPEPDASAENRLNSKPSGCRMAVNQHKETRNGTRKK